jgi:hypothetical protein
VQVVNFSDGSNYIIYLNYLYELAKEWQTLIAGLVALYGGWTTLKASKLQSKTTLEIEEEHRKVEAYAARAVMPLALSELSDYAENCIVVLTIALDEPNTHEARQIATGLPPSPTDLVDPFKQAIKLFDDPVRKQLADILSFYQVHEARLRPLKAGSISSSNFITALPQALIDAADLKSKADNLFDWARREEEGDIPRSTAKDIRSAIFVSVPTYQPEDNVLELIEARRRREGAA